jgi:hypothetical protein
VNECKSQTGLGFVAANSWKLGWQPDSKVKGVVAASAQNEKMERKITSTYAHPQAPLPLDPANFKRQRRGTAAMPERS